MEVGIWGTRTAGGRGFSLAPRLGFECKTRVMGTQADAKDESCKLEEEGEPWPLKGTGVMSTSGVARGRSGSDCLCICLVEASKYEL